MSSEIIWYNPETDDVVTQCFDSGVERIFDYDPAFTGDFVEESRRVSQHMQRNFFRNIEYTLYYGTDYHPLEHGLWVRLGEV